MNVSFQKDVTSKLLAQLQVDIEAACEPIVQEAIKGAENAARHRVAEFAISIAKCARVDWRGDELIVTVRFDKPGSVVPTYQYACVCGTNVEVVRTMATRNDKLPCYKCHKPMTRKTVYAVPAKFTGRVLQGGGPDRFTADSLGIPLRDLPSGLRTDK